MTMENPENIRYVCNHCSEKTKATTQSNLPSLADLAGKYVKKRFVKNNKAEHMWVKVTSVNEVAGTLMGILDNDPVVITNVSINQEVIVYREEIEAVMEG